MNCTLRTFDGVGNLAGEIFVTGAESCAPGSVARAVGWLDPTMASAVQYPTAELSLQAWGMGFGLPLTLYLAAYAVGRVVGMFDKP